MLIIFAISVTPTIVFHNWFANHIDSVKKTAGNNQLQVGKKLFNCHCNHIVAESPFTEPSFFIFVGATPFFPLVKSNIEVQFKSSPHLFYSLRGPPVV